MESLWGECRKSGSAKRRKDSVGHGVGHDIDPHGIGFLNRELFEVPRIFSFAFPAVTQIGIVADEYHDSACIVVDSAIVRDAGIGTRAIFPKNAGLTPLPCSMNRRELRLFFEVVDAVEDFVFERYLLRFSIW